MEYEDAQGNTLSDDEPTPWWPCPRCGDVHWRPLAMVWQRQCINVESGNEHDPDLRNKPTGVMTVCQCYTCGKYLDLARYYRWPSFEEPDGLYPCPDCGHFTRDHLDGCADCGCDRGDFTDEELLADQEPLR